MAVRFRHILIILAVVSVLGAGLIAVFFWFVFSAFDQIESYADVPPEITEARILSGGEFLSREEFFKLKTQSFLSLMLQTATELDEPKKQQKMQSEMAKKIAGFSDCYFDPASGEVVFAGMFGAEVIDRGGTFKREVLFQPATTKIKAGWYEGKNYGIGFSAFRIVDLDKNGSYEFVASGGMGGLAVFDSSGNGLWRYGSFDIDLGDVFDEDKLKKSQKKNILISGVTTGDLDGDGTEEVIFTTSQNEIVAFDHKGAEKWRREDKSPGTQLRVMDVDGDKKPEIIESNYSAPKMRDFEGNLAKDAKTVIGGDDFFVTDDGKTKKLNFIKFAKNKITVTGEAGKVIWEADAPFSEIKSRHVPLREQTASDSSDKEYLYPIHITQVKLRGGEAAYLAVLGTYLGSNRAVLYIYSPEGKLVYNEILPEESKTLMALPHENGDGEDILVGGKQTIWRYAIK
jgi:hypothetical protein